MKDLGIFCALFIGAFLIAHTFAGFIQRETIVTSGGIYINRVSLPLVITHYSIDKNKGKEEIAITRVFGTSEVIKYEKGCECITWYHKIGSFAISRWDDGTFRQYGDRVPPAEMLSEKAKPYLEKALVTRNATKARFASILKEAEYE